MQYIDLDFEVQPEEIGAERTQLLRDATAELDRYGRQLAPNRGGETAEGDFAREFAEDYAKLGTPDILPLNLETLSAEPQVETRALLETSKFYWLKLPVSLTTRPGWGFNQLQFKAEFNVDDVDLRRPRVHDALPTEAWVTKAKASAQLSLGLRGDLKVATGLPPTPVPGGGELQADVAAETAAAVSLVSGPFDYEVRVPHVERSNLDLHDVRWLLSGKRLVSETIPGCGWCCACRVTSTGSSYAPL